MLEERLHLDLWESVDGHMLDLGRRCSKTLKIAWASLQSGGGVLNSGLTDVEGR